MSPVSERIGPTSGRRAPGAHGSHARTSLAAFLGASATGLLGLLNGSLPGLGAALLLGLGAACSHPPVPPHSTAQTANGEARVADGGTPSGRTASLRFETEAVYTASLVHWVDSLAGTSGGKTVPVYRHLWTSRFGPLGPEDRQALVAFRSVRRSRSASLLCGSADPQEVVDPGSGWRIRFLLAALKASDLEGFYAGLRPCLSDAEIAKLVEAIERFRPGFDLFWSESSYLRAFDATFRTYLQEGEIPGYLSVVARFYDVHPEAAPPPILCFVLLPVNGSTHAQEVGRRLLIEIRPSDTPRDQVAVVCHESAHFFFDLTPASWRQAMERRAREASPRGEEAWRALQEALPTALGQGLAVARLTPTAFDSHGVWYHLPEIDRYAKRLYPIVRREIDAGRTIDGPFLEEAVRAFDLAAGPAGG